MEVDSSGYRHGPAEVVKRLAAREDGGIGGACGVVDGLIFGPSRRSD